MNRRPQLALSLFLPLLAAVAPAQDLSRVRDLERWKVRDAGRGVSLWRQEFADLFGSPQSLAVLRVDLDPRAHRIRVVDAGGRRRTSALARQAGALAAVNGGFFEPDGAPRGLLLIDGELLSPATAGQGAFGVDRKGRVEIGQRPAGDWPGVEHALGAGPILLRDGGVVDHGERQRGIRHPRTALGTTARHELVLLAVDGRNERAAGMSFEETAQVLKALGCRDAVNLDGGGSTTMWIAGLGVVNHPSDNERFDAAGEREVGNAVLLMGRSLLAMDNVEAELVPEEGWEVEREGRGMHGTDFAYATDGEGRRASWVLVTPAPGGYRLEARWPRLAQRDAGRARLTVGDRQWDLEPGRSGGRWVEVGDVDIGEVEELSVSWEGVVGSPLLIDAVRLVQVEGRAR